MKKIIYICSALCGLMSLSACGGTEKQGSHEGTQAILEKYERYLTDPRTYVCYRTEGDLKIDGFGRGSEDGIFDLSVSVDGIYVGDGATAANLAKVFGIEGAAELGGTSATMRSDGTLDRGFSSDNVEVAFGAPLGGKVKFTVVPKSGGEGARLPTAFFFRVKMK